MPKEIVKEATQVAEKEVKKKASAKKLVDRKASPRKEAPKKTSPTDKASKKAAQKKAIARKAASGKAATERIKEEGKKPSIRAIYANSKNTLMPLGFGTDFKTKKPVVIFSDLSTTKVHTITLAMWNRMKLKEIKGINPET